MNITNLTSVEVVRLCQWARGQPVKYMIFSASPKACGS